MARELLEGDFYGKATKVELGYRNGKPLVRITMQVSEGEHKNKSFDYEGKLDNDNIKYTKRSLVSLGWKGQKIATAEADIKTADATVPFVLRIAEFDRKDGSEVRRWTAVDRIGGAPPLEKAKPDDLAKWDSWFADVGDVGGASNGSSGGGHPNAPGNDSDLPF
ncbi:MAG: hypothetical protein AB7L94_42075 [Kofleriaceae bacterium]